MRKANATPRQRTEKTSKKYSKEELQLRMLQDAQLHRLLHDANKGNARSPAAKKHDAGCVGDQCAARGSRFEGVLGEDEERKLHHRMVESSFSHYLAFANEEISKLERSWCALPTKHQNKVPDMDSHFDALRTAAARNMRFVRKFLRDREVAPEQIAPYVKQWGNMDKIRSTLVQFCREWSAEGAEERLGSYKPVLDALESRFAAREAPELVRVLVPGSGLGRLPYEISKLDGYFCEANEIMASMIIPAKFMLSGPHDKEAFQLSPFLLQTVNVVNHQDPVRTLLVPDETLEHNLLDSPRFCYTEGDFVSLYSKSQKKFDAICTCFFLDTASNVLQYVDVISELLSPEGVWINCGPLLYHMHGIPGQISVELTLDQLMCVVKDSFSVLEERFIETFYAANCLSMCRNLYKCYFFVAQRKQPQGSCSLNNQKTQ